MKNKNLDYSERFISFKLIEYQSIFRDTRFIFPFAIFYCFEFLSVGLSTLRPKKQRIIIPKLILFRRTPIKKRLFSPVRSSISIGKCQNSAHSRFSSCGFDPSTTFRQLFRQSYLIGLQINLQSSCHSSNKFLPLE